MKKSVLFVIDNLVMGGVTRVLSNLLQHLDYSKYDVDLLVLHYYEDMPVSIPPQVTVLKGDRSYACIDRSIGSILKSKDLSALFGKLKLVFLLKSGLIKSVIRASRAKLLAKSYDTEISCCDGFTEIFIAQGKTPRKLAWVHSDISVFNDSARYAGLIQQSLDQMDGCICVSQQVKRAYEQQYHVKNAQVIHNIMDDKTIRLLANVPVQLPPADAGSIRLVSVGRLCEAKNYFRFIHVHKMLRNAGYPVISHVIGDGEDRDALEQEIANCGVSDTFFLLGKKDNPFPYVKQADLFILSSNHEGLPTVLFEALILGVPCVSTRVAGAEEILGTQYGIITEKSDDALFAGIQKMLTGTNLAEYQKAASCYPYSINTIIKQIEDIL